MTKEITIAYANNQFEIRRADELPEGCIEIGRGDPYQVSTLIAMTAYADRAAKVYRVPGFDTGKPLNNLLADYIAWIAAHPLRGRINFNRSLTNAGGTA